MTSRIRVLDHGYIELKDSMGSDLSVVNDARVSYEKETSEMRPQDERLLEFLGEHDHTAPFRGQVLKFEVRAPLMTARQWYKYAVASAHLDDQFAWNEASRRYVTEEPEFYVPDQWRAAPENKKQGSGGPLSRAETKGFIEALETYQERGKYLYECALSNGICAEQARLFLPAYGLYVRWRWTASLQAVAHFCRQRLADDAQVEIRKYAVCVERLSEERFPLAWAALRKQKE